MKFLSWLEHLAFSQWILTDLWAHPMLLSMHTIGMAFVVGIVLMLDLRVLGFAPGLSLGLFERLLGLAWAGFGLNLVSGILLFMAYATTLILNWTFDLKLGLILAGGISVWSLWRTLRAGQQTDGVVVFGDRAKTLAVISALFWLGAIVAGRYIAFTLPEGA
jgi:hypothetical protein